VSRARVIAVVDDSPSVRETIGFILTMEGYEVHTATNGSEALDLVRSLKPPAVLLDVMMPGIDGIEVCRRLKADPEVADTCVVMITTMAQRIDRERAEAAGVDRFLTKFFDDEQVLAILDEVYGSER
jgi:CheY-like chemotaxis protein